MNEITGSQLHADAIKIQDTQAARIRELEQQVDGMGLILHCLRGQVDGLTAKVEEAHALSVMSQSVVTHYVDSHLIPMFGLLAQINPFARC